ncbi:MAG: hypothetical protein KVP17_001504 [Porospora cf. gigantea B]|uniref:uncharacterized protein n=1 Tax=Porospora cf. gigantea B TaxID=2853592 RepID=UPI003571FA9E|nr:MAG: hypothetical protein KVP17_001504 [Porospora cf. gigantea B]
MAALFNELSFDRKADGETTERQHPVLIALEELDPRLMENQERRDLMLGNGNATWPTEIQEQIRTLHSEQEAYERITGRQPSTLTRPPTSFSDEHLDPHRRRVLDGVVNSMWRSHSINLQETTLGRAPLISPSALNELEADVVQSALMLLHWQETVLSKLRSAFS